MLAGAIDSSILLADSLASSSTSKAFGFLENGEKLIYLTSGETRHLRSYHFARCFFTAYWNIGGQVRQSIEGSAGDSAALRFFRRSCTLTEETASTFADEMLAAPPKPSLVIKLEFLAGCLYAIGEKKEAYDTYISAIVKSAPKLPEDVALLSKAVQRLTRIAMLDLILPATQISLLPVLDRSVPSPVIASLLEEQIRSLQSSVHKTQVRDAITVLFQDVLQIYNTELFLPQRFW